MFITKIHIFIVYYKITNYDKITRAADFFFVNGRVIPCEITHSKNGSPPIVFILSTQSIHPMRVHNPEYQPPVTSGSRVTGCTNLVN